MAAIQAAKLKYPQRETNQRETRSAKRAKRDTHFSAGQIRCITDLAAQRLRTVLKSSIFADIDRAPEPVASADIPTVCPRIAYYRASPDRTFCVSADSIPCVRE
jgi:hypothetical protein